MRPVEIALQLIELLNQRRVASVTRLSRLTGIPPSTVQRSLKALEKAGWISSADAGRPKWSLTVKAMLATNGRAVGEQRGLRRLALPLMEELRLKTSESIHLAFRCHRSVVLVERLNGPDPLGYCLPYGATSTLNASAAGKAILAGLSRQELEDYLLGPLPRATVNTLATAAQLRRDVEQARVRGFSMKRSENIANAHAVGAAICDAAGRPFAALTVSGPAARMTSARMDQYGPLVAYAARRISQAHVSRSGAAFV